MKSFIRILLSVFVVLLAGCSHKEVDFNFKGKGILYTEKSGILKPKTINYLNYSELTTYRVPDIDAWGCSTLKIVSKGGVIGCFPLLDKENILSLIDLKNNDTRKIHFNDLIKEGYKEHIFSLSVKHGSLMVVYGLKNIYYYSLKSQKLLENINLQYTLANSAIQEIRFGQNNTTAVMFHCISEASKVREIYVLSIFSGVALDSFRNVVLPKSYLSNWSPDRTRLIVSDSAHIPIIIHYPSLQVDKLDGIVPDSLCITGKSFFIDNDLLVFPAAKSTDSKDRFCTSQLYLYSLIEKRIIKQLTYGPYNKEICDIWY